MNLKNDSYLLHKVVDEQATPAGYLCRFKLTEATLEQFYDTVAPYIQDELATGSRRKLTDGRTYLIFYLGQGKGDVFLQYFLETGRYLTDEEAAALDAEEKDEQEIQDSLLIPYRQWLN